MSRDNLFEGFEVVSVYTRHQAMEDGVLVDVSQRAKEAGFKLHTVVTRNVWERCVGVPQSLPRVSRGGLEGQGQSEEGRLWDVLWMASIAARRAPVGENLVTFKVSVVDAQRSDGSTDRQEHVLWLHVGPGDRAEPVPSLYSRTGLTIMFPEDY